MFGRKKSPESRRRPLDRQAVPGASVFSYYNGEQPQKPEQTPQRKPPRPPMSKRQKLTMLYGIAGLFLLICLFCTTLSTAPAISYVGGAADSPYRPTAEYQAAANEIASAELGSRSKFTINTGKIEHGMLARYPELAAAHISLPVVGRRPNLILAVRKPALILTSASRVLVLDGKGRAVATSDTLPASVKQGLPTVEDSNTLPIKVGDQAVTSNTVDFIRLALAQLKAKNLAVERLSMPAIANELDIKLKDVGYFIKCDLSGDARVQIGSFLAVRDSGATPAEYMDVRVEEKVFYK